MPSRTLTAEMSYMDHQLQPEDLLHFVELRIFTRAWDKDLRLDDEVALSSLQICPMANPKAGVSDSRDGRAEETAVLAGGVAARQEISRPGLIRLLRGVRRDSVGLCISQERDGHTRRR